MLLQIIMKIIRLIDSGHVNIETINGKDANSSDKTETRSVIHSVRKTVNRCCNKILEIEFNDEETPYHGLLIIPLILVVILVNLGYIFYPKNLANYLHSLYNK